MKFSKPVLTIFSVFILGGCGGDESSFNGSSDTSSAVSSFDGTWSNGCEYDQFLGTAKILTLKINGSNATLNTNTYNNSSCSDTAIDSTLVSMELNYPESLALNNCLNAEKVNASLKFPITINGEEFSEAQFNALPTLDQTTISVITPFDLLCVNSTATLLFTGDSSSGLGLSEETRPTRASLNSGIGRLQ